MLHVQRYIKCNNNFTSLILTLGLMRSQPATGLSKTEPVATNIPPQSAPSVRSQPSPPTQHIPRTPTTADCSNVLDYDTELKKHGWKMEIPGDPLGLK